MEWLVTLEKILCEVKRSSSHLSCRLSQSLRADEILLKRRNMSCWLCWVLLCLLCQHLLWQHYNPCFHWHPVSKQKALLNPRLLRESICRSGGVCAFWLCFGGFFFLTFQSTPSKLRTIKVSCMLETSIKICNTKWREWQPLEWKTSSMLTTQKLRSMQQLSAFLGGRAASLLVISCLHSEREKRCISLKKIKDLGKQFIVLYFRGKPESFSSCC